MILRLIKERLSKFLNIFRFYKKKDEIKSEKSTKKIPNSFSDGEKIIRTIFSPKNLNKSGEILPNTYRTPALMDEVSVNRLDYTNETFCKKLGKKIQQPKFKKNYFGFGLHSVKLIKDTNSNIIYTPIFKPKEFFNPFHSDIKIGYVAQKGKPLPSIFQKKTIDLANSAKLFEDFNPESDGWEGDRLTI